MIQIKVPMGTPGPVCRPHQCQHTLPMFRRKRGIAQVTQHRGDGFSFDLELSTPEDDLNAELRQEILAARLPAHPTIQGVVNVPGPDESLTCAVRPTLGITLMQFINHIWTAGYAEERLWYVLNKTAKAVALCGVSALLHLGEHDTVHGDINPEAFNLVGDINDPNFDFHNPIFVLTGFGCSRVAGVALAPGTKHLSSVPPELAPLPTLLNFMNYAKYMDYAAHDMFGLGTTLWAVYNGCMPRAARHETYAIKGDLRLEGNQEGLKRASFDVMQCEWMPALSTNQRISRPVYRFLSRCLHPRADDRLTPQEAACHPALADSWQHLDELHAPLALAQQKRLDAIQAALPALMELGLHPLRPCDSTSSLRPSCIPAPVKTSFKGSSMHGDVTYHLIVGERMAAYQLHKASGASGPPPAPAGPPRIPRLALASAVVLQCQQAASTTPPPSGSVLARGGRTPAAACIISSSSSVSEEGPAAEVVTAEEVAAKVVAAEVVAAEEVAPPGSSAVLQLARSACMLGAHLSSTSSSTSSGDGGAAGGCLGCVAPGVFPGSALMELAPAKAASVAASVFARLGTGSSTTTSSAAPAPAAVSSSSTGVGPSTTSSSAGQQGAPTAASSKSVPPLQLAKAASKPAKGCVPRRGHKPGKVSPNTPPQLNSASSPGGAVGSCSKGGVPKGGARRVRAARRSGAGTKPGGMLQPPPPRSPPSEGPASSSSSSPGWGGIDALHFEVAGECSNAGDLLAGCYARTGEGPCAALLGSFLPTLTCAAQ